MLETAPHLAEPRFNKEKRRESIQIRSDEKTSAVSRMTPAPPPHTKPLVAIPCLHLVFSGWTRKAVLPVKLRVSVKICQNHQMLRDTSATFVLLFLFFSFSSERFPQRFCGQKRKIKLGWEVCRWGEEFGELGCLLLADIRKQARWYTLEP